MDSFIQDESPKDNDLTEVLLNIFFWFYFWRVTLNCPRMILKIMNCPWSPLLTLFWFWDQESGKIFSLRPLSPDMALMLRKQGTGL